jgi:hypothetical protein
MPSGVYVVPNSGFSNDHGDMWDKPPAQVSGWQAEPPPNYWAVVQQQNEADESSSRSTRPTFGVTTRLN